MLDKGVGVFEGVGGDRLEVHQLLLLGLALPDLLGRLLPGRGGR